MGKALGAFLLSLALGIASLQPSIAFRTGKFSGFFGCVFSDVCTKNEECVFDGLFGNCQNKVAEKDRYQYDMRLDQVITLQEALKKLIRGDYAWDSTYTQCVLADILLAFRLGGKPDPSFCDSRSFDDKDPALDLESIDPETEVLLRKIIEDYRAKGGGNEDDDDDEMVSMLPPDRSMNVVYGADGPEDEDYYSHEKRESPGFVNIHKYFKSPDQRKSASDGDAVGYPTSPRLQNIFQLPIPPFNFYKPQEERRVAWDTSNPGDFEASDDPGALPESSGDNYDSEVDEYLSKLDLDQLMALKQYIKATRNKILAENPEIVGTQQVPSFELPLTSQLPSTTENAPRPSGMPRSLSDLLAKQGLSADGALSENDVVDLERIFDQENRNENTQEYPEIADETMTSEETKLLGNLLAGKTQPKDLSNEEIEKMTQHVMALLKDFEDSEAEEEMEGNMSPREETGRQAENGESDFLWNKGLMNSDLPVNIPKTEQPTEKAPEEEKPVQKPPEDFLWNKEMINSDLLANIPPEENAPAEKIAEKKKPAEKGVALPHQGNVKEKEEVYFDGNSVYLTINRKFRSVDEGLALVANLQKKLELPPGTFDHVRVEDNTVTFIVNPNSKNINGTVVAETAEKDGVNDVLLVGAIVIAAGIGNGKQIKVPVEPTTPKYFVLTFVLCGIIAGTLLAVIAIYLIKRHTRSKEKLAQLTATGDQGEASKDYQDLCRQRMQTKASEKPEPLQAGGRVSSVASETAPGSASSRSSTSSWYFLEEVSEEPVTSNMDITTGHIILSYMEDHLKNKDRLDQEWEELYTYVPEPNATEVGSSSQNARKNRYSDILPYDHSRVILNKTANVLGSDYINANTITDHDPRNPAYIATQGPLPHTVADFWQMIWEQGSVVIVQLTKLTENGVAMCHRYWPEEGSDLYHIYEVHLVSEHIWCDDYLVRSFYLKNLQTNETRTVTQFHFLTWPDLGVPASAKALLDFRRKVNKSYRGRSCPIVVHCSDGVGRTGTYCLIDMVLNRMNKGAKEIDIAATLEHIRDQRMGMVKTKEQLEFVLAAVAEEVHAILKALPQ